MIAYGTVNGSDRLRRLLIAHRARLLDPRLHPSTGNGAVLGSTVYCPSRLLAGRDWQQWLTGLAPVLAQRGHRAVARPSSIRFDPDGDGWSDGIDAWSVLAGLRGRPATTGQVGLDHLLSTAEQPGGNPLAAGIGTPGLDHYGVPDYPGRGPLFLAWPAPVDLSEPRPGIAVLDTGVGRHPWFDVGAPVTNYAVTDDLVLEVLPDPLTGPATQTPEPMGPDFSLIGALGSHVGHGTFIAGLLRQGCPAAAIHAVAIMGADGIVAERTLVKGLTAVADRAEAEPGWIQAAVLSLGYYSESVQDEHYNSTVKVQLVRLARAGVAVFCAAGNDATEQPSYPAAFAMTDPFTTDQDLVPLVSVAATNTDGSLALFSNDGPWVTASAVGVGVVSALPTDLDGSDQPVRLTRGPVGGRARGAIDPDGFRAGFASWNGTSFATPILAASYLAALQARGLPGAVHTRRDVLAPFLR